MPVELSDHPLVLFKRLNASFASLLAKPRSGLIEPLLDEAHDIFERHVEAGCKGLGAMVACRGGCASCCSLRVAATAPEIFLISQHLKALKASGQGILVDTILARVEAAHVLTSGEGELSRMEAGEACPFIEDGLCVIYAQRPLACRGHASFSETACVEALSGEEADVPISEIHMTSRSIIQNAMQSAMRDAGLGWGIYELIQGLVIAMDDDMAEAAWLGGEDVFADACIADISAEEMAETFDAIKAVAA